MSEYLKNVQYVKRDGTSGLKCPEWPTLASTTVEGIPVAVKLAAMADGSHRVRVNIGDRRNMLTLTGDEAIELLCDELSNLVGENMHREVDAPKVQAPTTTPTTPQAPATMPSAGTMTYGQALKALVADGIDGALLGALTEAQVLAMAGAL